MDQAKTETSNELKYGGCEGPEAMYVKLISYDGHEFIIKREYALTSGTIKAMLSGPGKINNRFNLNLFLFLFLFFYKYKYFDLYYKLKNKLI